MGYKPTLKYIQGKYNGEYEVALAVAAVGAVVGADSSAQATKVAPTDNAAQPATSGAVGFAESLPVIDIDPTPVSAQTDLLAFAAGSSVKSWVDVIRAKVESADSLESLRDDLLASYAELDSAELVKVMALAFAAADLSGRYDVSEGG